MSTLPRLLSRRALRSINLFEDQQILSIHSTVFHSLINYFKRPRTSRLNPKLYSTSIRVRTSIATRPRLYETIPPLWLGNDNVYICSLSFLSNKNLMWYFNIVSELSNNYQSVLWSKAIHKSKNSPFFIIIENRD